MALTRREALTVCAVDKNGSDPFEGRGFHIRNYCGARRWVKHYRDQITNSAPTKFTNGYARTALSKAVQS